MSTITTRDGVNLHVDDSGESGDLGRTVVLIHGWPLSAESWSAQTSVLRKNGYRVVAYDRRGFGRSDKPDSGYEYDTLAKDLEDVLTGLDLTDVTLVGFSMGGGEVARYFSVGDTSRIRSVVFAGAVPPYLLKTDDNPDGPLTEEAAKEMEDGLRADRDAFFEDFTTGFFSVGDDLKVSEETRKEAVRLAQQSDQTAALGCMEAFGTTDFREDLPKIEVPTLIIHGDSDDIVPFEGSGKRTAEIVPHTRTTVIEGAPHGLNASHAAEFNASLLEFLAD
ncbi:alpha/beta fold hydrolase [Corynebacterium glyciniphilum]|uniref:alpha/beta fold hydrolase n=1 Tax=Corynebacterium glyciniphilum TaxID=1404244 RepID=UPI00264ED07F|nr:alpha/beta hydrolase [Corynebacterium glyciniphilum]MDN5682732.1 alpha/beta hydrolase [Corynebacterium glyciniphilum]MDN6705055.1 alpha/beta hydrolase [Corynebacterium glyciniphilum]